ncbi:MAG TPA: hypothetical protein VKG05_17100 [Steroidobacteraceae bacterium]|nr:hypothetical protein [Steroidobacteraceae bacterium]
MPRATASALVVVALAIYGLDSDLPIYFGLGGILAAYIVASLGSRLGPASVVG